MAVMVADHRVVLPLLELGSAAALAGVAAVAEQVDIQAQAALVAF